MATTTDFLTVDLDTGAYEQMVALNRRRSRDLYRALEELPKQVLQEEEKILIANSPERTGLLKESYVITERPAAVGAMAITGGATLTNTVPYFGFNLFGTGQRGAAAGVSRDLFGDNWQYGTSPGMPPFGPLLRAWEDAPANIERIALGMYSAMLR